MPYQAIFNNQKYKNIDSSINNLEDLSVGDQYIFLQEVNGKAHSVERKILGFVYVVSNFAQDSKKICSQNSVLNSLTYDQEVPVVACNIETIGKVPLNKDMISLYGNFVIGRFKEELFQLTPGLPGFNTEMINIDKDRYLCYQAEDILAKDYVFSGAIFDNNTSFDVVDKSLLMNNNSGFNIFQKILFLSIVVTTLAFIGNVYKNYQRSPRWQVKNKKFIFKLLVYSANNIYFIATMLLNILLLLLGYSYIT